MTGPKIAEILKPIEHRTPGPGKIDNSPLLTQDLAYYHPEIPKPKSYLVNTDSKWL